MAYVQRANLTFLGIDDELKDDPTSVYSSKINSSFYPVPADISSNAAPVYEYQQYGVRMDP
jgi:hypothetical protein